MAVSWSHLLRSGAEAALIQRRKSHNAKLPETGFDCSAPPRADAIIARFLGAVSFGFRVGDRGSGAGNFFSLGTSAGSIAISAGCFSWLPPTLWGQIARCFYYFFMIVVVIRYKTKATARRALTFIVRIFVNDTIAIAVWTSFHVCVHRS